MLRLSKTQFERFFGKKTPEEKTKYRNEKCEWNGLRFDSKHEMERYMVLWDDQKHGKISHLRTQVRFELIPAKRIDGKVVERACWYIADFVYMKGGQMVVEDAKSEITRKNPAYIIKRKLMYEKHGVRIQEV